LLNQLGSLFLEPFVKFFGPYQKPDGYDFIVLEGCKYFATTSFWFGDTENWTAKLSLFNILSNYFLVSILGHRENESLEVFESNPWEVILLFVYNNTTATLCMVALN